MGLERSAAHRGALVAHRRRSGPSCRPGTRGRGAGRPDHRRRVPPPRPPWRPRRWTAGVMSGIPVLIVVLLVATLFVARAGRNGGGTDGPTTVSPEEPLPAPRAGIDVALMRQLAARETVRLVRQPAVVVGYLLSVVGVLAWGEGTARVMHIEAMAVALMSFPLAGLTLVATNLATLKASRFGAAGIIDTTAASPASRTAAHLLSVVGPAGVFAAFLAAWNAVM